MIKRSKIVSAPGQRRRGVDQNGKVEEEVLNLVKTGFDGAIPIPYLTGITKKYNKTRCLHEEDKFVQQFVERPGFVSSNKLLEYLKVNMVHPKGQPLSDDAVKRVYSNGVNSQGLMTYQSLMKMGEETGVSLTEKQAKEIVRRYGKRKQFLSLDDMLHMNNRCKNKSPPKSKVVQKGR